MVGSFDPQGNNVRKYKVWYLNIKSFYSKVSFIVFSGVSSQMSGHRITLVITLMESKGMPDKHGLRASGPILYRGNLFLLFMHYSVPSSTLF